METKKITQDVLKWTVVGGSAVIAVGGLMQLAKATNLKSAIMPLVTLLVGVSAFSYAMNDKVSLLPKVDSVGSEGDKGASTKGASEEEKANASGRNFRKITTFPTKNRFNDTSAKQMPTKSAGENSEWCCVHWNTSGACIEWESRPVNSKLSCGGSMA